MESACPWQGEGAVGLECGDGGKGGARLVGTWAPTLSELLEGSDVECGNKDSAAVRRADHREGGVGTPVGRLPVPAGERPRQVAQQRQLCWGPGEAGCGRQSPLEPPPHGITELLLVGGRAGAGQVWGRVGAGSQVARVNLRCAEMSEWTQRRQNSGGRAGSAPDG